MAVGISIFVPPQTKILLVEGSAMNTDRIFIRCRSIMRIGGFDCETNYFLCSKLEMMDLGILGTGEQIFCFNPCDDSAVQVNILSIKNKSGV